MKHDLRQLCGCASFPLVYSAASDPDTPQKIPLGKTEGEFSYNHIAPQTDSTLHSVLPPKATALISLLLSERG